MDLEIRDSTLLKQNTSTYLEKETNLLGSYKLPTAG